MIIIEGKVVAIMIAMSIIIGFFETIILLNCNFFKKATKKQQVFYIIFFSIILGSLIGTFLAAIGL